MERTCTYEQFIVIFLALSNLAVTETKEFYCTRASKWRKAMSTCLDLGGKPMSYRDIADTPDVKLKRGTSVWTADYGYWEIVESLPQLTKDYECGYMRFKQEHKGLFTYGYSSSTGVEYDDCSNTRPYFCETESSNYKYGRDTWFQAYQSCKSPNSLWSGHEFRYPYLENPQLWVKSARKFIRDTLKDTIPTKEQLVQCGTSEAPVNREEGDNCEQLFQAVCILETRIDDTRLSQSCLQDTPTTAPATTVSTRKTTLKPTRPTTQLITTTKPSQQSTKSIYSTSSLSTPETPAPTPATTVSTGKTTLEPTRSTTQRTATMEPTRQSTEIFNGTTFKSTPGEVTKTLPKDNSTSIDDGPSKIRIIIITVTAILVIVSCIAAIYIHLVLFTSRKSPKCQQENSRTVQFSNNGPTTVRVLVSRNGQTADRVCNNDETEVYAHYETIPDSIPDNIQSIYVSRTDEDRHGSSVPANIESEYINKTPDTYYEDIPDNMQAVYADEGEEGHHEASAPVSNDSMYANTTPETNYEDIPNNIKSAYADEGEEGPYEALSRVKEPVYVNKTPEGYYDDLITDDLYIHPV